jgi:hypothetical protein
MSGEFQVVAGVVELLAELRIHASNRVILQRHVQALGRSRIFSR